MLVLTRKSQEQIRVGDNITITILRIRGNTVRLGIEAPRGVRVVRGELPNFDSPNFDIDVEFDGEPADPETSTTAESAEEAAGEELEEAPLAAVLRRRSRSRTRVSAFAG